MPTRLVSMPGVSSVTLSESPLYQFMGRGLSDQIFLIGHADGLNLNDPYPVLSVADAIKRMNADQDSPLLRALLQSYFAGARDIWLVASAPMSEYEPALVDRTTAYYEMYAERLETTYSLMQEWEMADYVVPLEAPFNSTVDFLGPLVGHCVTSQHLTGKVRLGFLGTRGQILAENVDSLVNDGRLNGVFGDAGKLVLVFAGDVAYSMREMPILHTASVATSAAAQLSTLPLDRGLTYQQVRNAINVAHPDLGRDDLNRLAEIGLNPVARTTIGKRGASYRTVFLTDNTLAADGSDYWSLPQMRLVAVCTSQIRAFGRKAMGNIEYQQFRMAVEGYLNSLVSNSYIRDFTLQIDRYDRHTVIVNLVLVPYFGIRELVFDIAVGPMMG